MQNIPGQQQSLPSLLHRGRSKQRGTPLWFELDRSNELDFVAHA